ncbi:S66 peptidase family protein [Calidifontibacter terrae]
MNRRPDRLRPGSQVAVLSASGPVNQEVLARGLQVLRNWELDPVVLPSALAAPNETFPHLAGSDRMRADDLVHALTGPEFDAVIFAKGGDGAPRALELIDWPALAAQHPRPRWVVGFSDVTAVLEAVLRHLQWVSLYGPMPATSYFFGEPAQRSLRGFLFGDPPQLHFPGGWTITPGRAEGVLVGGCLSLLVATAGSDTAVSARDALMFLEDEDETAYRLDRMFTQLRRSGYLDGVRGVLLGTWDRCDEPSLVAALLRDRFGDLEVPVLAGLDVGHGVSLQSLPIGARAVLDTDTKSLHLRGRA